MAKRLWLTALACFGAHQLGLGSVSAAVITDVALVSGGPGVVSAIAPSDASQDLNSTVGTLVSGLTPASESDIESRSDTRVIQTFTGLDPATTSTSNIFSFTSGLNPDLRITVGGSFQTSGGTVGTSTNTVLATSTGSSFRFAASGNGTTTTPIQLTFLIDFGDYNGTTFNSLSNPVDAAGFTISNLKASQSVQVDFLDDAGNLLSRQSATGNDLDGADTDGATSNNGSDFFFGLDSVNGDIGQILITRSATGNGTTGNGLDDISFTTIPEPTGTLLLGGVALLALGRRRGK